MKSILRYLFVFATLAVHGQSFENAPIAKGKKVRSKTEYIIEYDAFGALKSKLIYQFSNYNENGFDIMHILYLYDTGVNFCDTSLNQINESGCLSQFFKFIHRYDSLNREVYISSYCLVKNQGVISNDAETITYGEFGTIIRYTRDDFLVNTHEEVNGEDIQLPLQYVTSLMEGLWKDSLEASKPPGYTITYQKDYNMYRADAAIYTKRTSFGNVEHRFVMAMFYHNLKHISKIKDIFFTYDSLQRPVKIIALDLVSWPESTVIDWKYQPDGSYTIYEYKDSILVSTEIYNTEGKVIEEKRRIDLPAEATTDKYYYGPDGLLLSIDTYNATNQLINRREYEYTFW